jgi:hypothetical protein
MFTHPHLSSQIASHRHRDMLASAQQHRLARQLRAQARASRPASRAARRLRIFLPSKTVAALTRCVLALPGARRPSPAP